MVKFTYVEEYLEVITGYRDAVTGKPTTIWKIQLAPIINLARYDVKVLESMTSHVTGGGALTERQGELALKIVLKYQRQLAQKGVDVSAVTSPQWRMPLRKMDYSRLLSLHNDTLIVKFPYNAELIENIRDFTKVSRGKCVFNKEAKVWEAGYTEYNLSWLHTWATTNNFEQEVG